jgi:2,5-diketo-D-gluconate reductase A
MKLASRRVEPIRADQAGSAGLYSAGLCRADVSGQATRTISGAARSGPPEPQLEEASLVTVISDVTLNNGQRIPQLGFGVFLIEPKDTVAAVSTALEAGYRHIDTAEEYGNEQEVGDAIRQSGLDRSEVFVTSKLDNDFHEPDDARLAFDESLKALGVDYLDLFLIHWPLPTRYDGDFVSTWQTLEEFYRDGRARSIGVSNFQAHHLRRLHGESEIIQAVN